MFGIVLTPVFFYTIDGLGQSKFFNSPFMQIASGIVLDCLRLGFVWRALRAAPQLFRREAPPPAAGEAGGNPAERNGHSDEQRSTKDKIRMSKETQKRKGQKQSLAIFAF